MKDAQLIFVTTAGDPSRHTAWGGLRERMVSPSVPNTSLTGSPYIEIETKDQMNCENCGHPLIEHGDYPEIDCDCCSGRIWQKTEPSLSGIEHELKEAEARKHGRRDGRIPVKFRQVVGFPDYMINRQGCVKHIETGRFCLFLRLTNTGGSMIMLQKNGKSYHKTVQELLERTFTDKEKN